MPTPYAYHHAAADLIHLYLTTHTFFSITSYSPFRSSSIDIPIIQSHGHTGGTSGTKTKGDDHGTLTNHTNGTTTMTTRGKQYYAGIDTCTCILRSTIHSFCLFIMNDDDWNNCAIGFAFGTCINWMQSSNSSHGRDNSLTAHNRGPLRLPCIDSCYSKDKRTPIALPYGMDMMWYDTCALVWWFCVTMYVCMYRWCHRCSWACRIIGSFTASTWCGVAINMALQIHATIRVMHHHSIPLRAFSFIDIYLVWHCQ